MNELISVNYFNQRVCLNEKGEISPECTEPLEKPYDTTNMCNLSSKFSENETA